MEAKKIRIIVNPLPNLEIPQWLKEVSLILSDADEVFFSNRAIVVEMQGDARFIPGDGGVEICLQGEDKYRYAFKPGAVFQIQRHFGSGVEFSDSPLLCWKCAELTGEIVGQDAATEGNISIDFQCGLSKCRRRWRIPLAIKEEKSEG